MELPAPEVCYRALQSRDARFDGLIFVGVRSTGIYCRPVCPARTAKFENCRFFASAAAAQDAGFRPCLRCRPETAPHLASWRGTSNTVSRALALIDDGALDGKETSVEFTRGATWFGRTPASSPLPPASWRFARSPLRRPGASSSPSNSSTKPGCPWRRSPSPRDSAAYAGSTKHFADSSIVPPAPCAVRAPTSLHKPKQRSR